MLTSSRALPYRHDTLREGAAVGLAAGVCIWFWILIVDIGAGVPFQTFDVLGGIVVFTVLHLLLNMLYGIILMSVAHASKDAPSVIIGGLFVFLTFEFAMAMLTILLSHTGLGDLAWLRIFGASWIGAVTALVLISRHHPLLARLHEAEAER